MRATMAEEARCAQNGLLVRSSGVFPEDSHIFGYASNADSIGCNRLRCTSCLAFVRQRPKTEIKPGLSPDPAHLYETEDWSRLGELKPDKHGRLYACRCTSWVEYGTTSLAEDDSMRPTPPWGCGGHPPITLPWDLDGIHLEPTTDAARLARDVLSRRRVPPRALEGEKAIPSRWLVKLVLLLGGSTNATDMAALVSPAVAAVLGERPSPVIRNEVIDFFGNFPVASGWEKLFERFLSAPGDFVGVVVPEQSPPTVEDVFAWTVDVRLARLASRSDPLDALTLDVVVRGATASHRRAAQARDKMSRATAERWANTLLEAVRCDDVAVAKRAEDIVGAAPGLALPLLEALRETRSARLVETAGKIAKIPGIEREKLVAFGDSVGGQVKAALRSP